MRSLVCIFLLTFSVAAKAANMCGIYNDGTAGKPNIAIISGTNRSGSNTLKVSKHLAELIETQGANVRVIDIAEIPMSTYEGSNYFKTTPEFQERYDKVLQNAGHVVVVLPEYHGSFPGSLKLFFDFLQVNFSGKPFSLVGVSAGRWGARTAQDMFAATLNHRGATVMGATRINIPQIDSKLTDGKINDPEVLKFVNIAVATMVKSAQTPYLITADNLKRFLGVGMVGRYKLNSGLVIRGPLSGVIASGPAERVDYLQFDGPTELRDGTVPQPGQGKDAHAQGFGTPIGRLKDGSLLSTISSPKTLGEKGYKVGEQVVLEFESGVVVSGTLTGSRFSATGLLQSLQILSFKDCTVRQGDKILFDPSWGAFDMAVGEYVHSASF